MASSQQIHYFYFSMHYPHWLNTSHLFQPLPGPLGPLSGDATTALQLCVPGENWDQFIRITSWGSAWPEASLLQVADSPCSTYSMILSVGSTKSTHHSLHKHHLVDTSKLCSLPLPSLLLFLFKERQSWLQAQICSWCLQKRAYRRKRITNQ